MAWECFTKSRQFISGSSHCSQFLLLFTRSELHAIIPSLQPALVTNVRTFLDTSPEFVCASSFHIVVRQRASQGLLVNLLGHNKTEEVLQLRLRLDSLLDEGNHGPILAEVGNNLWRRLKTISLVTELRRVDRKSWRSSFSFT